MLGIKVKKTKLYTLHICRRIFIRDMGGLGVKDSKTHQCINSVSLLLLKQMFHSAVVPKPSLVISKQMSGMHLKWVGDGQLLAHDEFNECNVPHCSPCSALAGWLFTKPDLQERLISYSGGEITVCEEALPSRMIVSTQRSEKNIFCTDQIMQVSQKIEGWNNTGRLTSNSWRVAHEIKLL